MQFRYLLLSLAAVLLASCGSDIALVSKERARSGAGYYSGSGYTTATPSAKVVSDGRSKPKDKHGMPLYSSSDRVRFVRTTAYTASEADHLQYGSLNATGTPLKYGSRVRSAAADWSVYPVGTVFKIKGMSPMFVVDDYGSALTGTGTIDIFTPTRSHMNQWGRRNVEISVLQWGSYARSAELLSKRTSYSHCARMYAAIQRQLGGSSRTAMR